MSFEAHAELLRLFLQHRGEIVNRLKDLLNAQRKSPQYQHDRGALSRRFEDCFFGLPALSSERAVLRGQLEEAHWARGFRPRQVTELFNDLINPTEMMVRGCYCWHQTRWPGRNGRSHYAQTLFNLRLIRGLTFLVMRIWDRQTDQAPARLLRVQGLLDELWQGSPAEQPVFVRDACWLIPVAQGPTTDELAAYFEVAEKVAEYLDEEQVVEICRSHVRVLGGHLTSQIRHYCTRDGVALDDHSIVLRTRTSNALDFGLLVQGLVPLLNAYERAIESGDAANRRKFAGAICQGVSADPEVFINRLDLLVPYSMIEYLFTGKDDEGRVAYTAMGQRHMRLIAEYRELIGRLSAPLRDDSLQFAPVEGGYSPYGALFGTPTNLIEDMALRVLQRGTDTRFGLEDVFADGGADRLAWINGWRDLPHVSAEVRELYKYPQEFANDVHVRVQSALDRCTATDASSGAGSGSLFFGAGEAEMLPARYFVSSDDELVAEGRAEACDETKLLRDRQEGYFAVCCETPGGWMAIRKDFLTDCFGAGQTVCIAGLPDDAAAVLSLMCPDQAMTLPSVSKA